MRRDVVVIGASAGGLDALKEVVRHLHADLPAAVMVVLHIPATSKSLLAPILNRIGGLPAVVPRHGDSLRPGYIYVAKPDQHLEVRDGVIQLTHGPRINGNRPSIDVLFGSAAAAYGERVVGVVLSGSLDDGSGGLAEICAAGGYAIVQKPEDALVDSMPRNAIELAKPDAILPASEIGPMIAKVVMHPTSERHQWKEGGADMEAVGTNDAPGEITGVTCPDCHGSIWIQKGGGGEVKFACRIGHSYSPESFVESQATNVENALWAGVRALEEQASISAVMAARAMRVNDRATADRYEGRRNVAASNAEALRAMLVGEGP